MRNIHKYEVILELRVLENSSGRVQVKVQKGNFYLAQSFKLVDFKIKNLDKIVDDITIIFMNKTNIDKRDKDYGSKRDRVSRFLKQKIANYMESPEFLTLTILHS